MCHNLPGIRGTYMCHLAHGNLQGLPWTHVRRSEWRHVCAAGLPLTSRCFSSHLEQKRRSLISANFCFQFLKFFLNPFIAGNSKEQRRSLDSSNGLVRRCARRLWTACIVGAKRLERYLIVHCSLLYDLPVLHIFRSELLWARISW